MDHRLSYFFGPPARFAAGIIAVAGIVAIFVGGPAGLILVVLGLIMISTYSGIELDASAKQ